MWLPSQQFTPSIASLEVLLEDFVSILLCDSSFLLRTTLESAELTLMIKRLMPMIENPLSSHNLRIFFIF